MIQRRSNHLTKWLHDHDSTDLGGRTIEGISTPGHTPDSICVFDHANGLLFSGNTYYPGPIWLFRPETDLVAYGRSVQTPEAALAFDLQFQQDFTLTPCAKR